MKNLTPQSPSKVQAKQIKRLVSRQFGILFMAVLLATGFTTVIIPCKLFAQVPTVSYAGPKTYTQGSAIPLLVPTTTGLGAGALSNTTLSSAVTANPGGLAVDPSGNVYVIISAVVYKIAAGTSTPVSVASGFNNPYDLAADASGNIYISDSGNNAIKEIPAGGGSVVTISSAFNDPVGLAIDATGDIYVADHGNNAIKEIMAGSSAVVTVASGITNLGSVAVDAAGNLYFGSGGEVEEIAFGSSTPVDFGSGISSANYIKIDSQGTLYVTGGGNALFQVPAGATFANTWSSGFLSPTGIAVDAAGNVYVADAGHKMIKEVKRVGGYYISPELPLGLSISNGNGVISGTPIVSSPAKNYTITAYNSHGGGSATLNITVNALPVPTISYSGPKSYNVGTTIAAVTPAGSGVAAPGYSGPFSIGAGINSPEGVAVDLAGNVYSSTPFTSQEIHADGSGTTTIGPGADYGAMAVDGAGNLYVFEIVYENNTYVQEILKIPAGGGTPVNTGFVGNMATDPAGNVYIVGGTKTTITKTPINGGPVQTITLTGQTNPIGGGARTAIDLAGDVYGSYYDPSTSTYGVVEVPVSGGPVVTIATGLSNATDLGVDAAGNLFVSGESSSKQIVEYPVGGGAPVTISATAGPTTFTVSPNGNIYVANQGNTGIIEFKHVGGYSIVPALPPGLSFNATTGVISGTPTATSPATNYTITGYNIGGGGSATINITVNPMVPPTLSYSSPQIYNLNTAIAPLSPTSIAVAPLAYSSAFSATGSGFVTPTGVAADAAGNVYVADFGNHLVKEVPAGGGAITTLGSGFTSPYGVAVDATGNVYVADYGASAIKKIPAGGGAPVTLGSGFSHPTSVAVDAAGNVYVADYSHSAIKEIPVGGGAPVTLGSGFSTPTGVAVDAAGNVYVADYGNNAVKEIPAGGGTPVTLGPGFNFPHDVALDEAGNVFVTEYNVADVREIAAGGGATTTAFTGFNHPVGIATSTTGSVYIADYSNNAIKQFKPLGGYFIGPALPAGLNFSTTTGTISGTPTVLSPAANYTVTAYNASGGNTATVNIAVVNDQLSSLVLSSGTLSPSFAPATTSYTAAVSSATTSVTETPTALDAGATITVNGTAVTSGTASPGIPLAMGSNTITTVVTGTGGAGTSTYTVKVGRGASDATINMFTISNGTLSPAFSAGTTNYTDVIANTTASITVLLTTNDPNATVTANGTPITSGVRSPSIPMTVGSNTLSIVVTAQNGVTSEAYTIMVTREASANALLASISTSPVETLVGTTGPGYLNFKASAANSVSSIQVIPTAKDPTATITVNGTPVVSGSASQAIALSVGANTITTVITAQDGVTTKTVIITVTRAAPSGINDPDQQLSVTKPAVNIQIENDGIVVHQGVSPNGDGINDYLAIDGITSYPNNRLMIMDRNGVMIYQTKGYDNSSKLFDGHSNINGKMQLPGTYFYSLDYTANGENKHKTGYIILKY